MILVAAAVEDHFLDSGSAGALGDDFSDEFGRGDVASALDLALHVRVQRAGSRERVSFVVVNHLHANVLERTIDAKARPLFGSRERLTHALVDPLAVQIARKFSCWHNSHCSSPSSDPDFLQQKNADPSLRRLLGMTNIRVARY